MTLPWVTPKKEEPPPEMGEVEESPESNPLIINSIERARQVRVVQIKRKTARAASPTKTGGRNERA